MISRKHAQEIRAGINDAKFYLWLYDVEEQIELAAFFLVSKTWGNDSLRVRAFQRTLFKAL